MADRIKVEVDGKGFWLTLREDSIGPLRLTKSRHDSNLLQSGNSRSEDSWSNKGGETEYQKFFNEHNDISVFHSTNGYSKEEAWSDGSKKKGFLGMGHKLKARRWFN